ncbi:MAG TPA: PQQ-binding-like beta-propeller repeat protein, partial [Bacteroidia bacterium]|nr:PQQ-binding-like beta-propeller repeat protein [Bacteroidia bacterium]
LYAIDAVTGSLKWNFPYNNFRSSPVIFDGVVYLSSYAHILAVDAMNGTLKWNYPATTDLEDMLSSACIVDKLGNVFVSSVSGSHN